MGNVQIKVLRFHGQSGSLRRYVVAVTYGQSLFNNFLFANPDWTLAEGMVADPMEVTKEESDTIFMVAPTLKDDIVRALDNRNSWRDTMKGWTK